MKIPLFVKLEKLSKWTNYKKKQLEKDRLQEVVDLRKEDSKYMVTPLTSLVSNSDSGESKYYDLLPLPKLEKRLKTQQELKQERRTKRKHEEIAP
ncbi:putative dnaJ-like protein subfamily C member 21 [Sesbania bispinosa]|nr:putative dnaJ-like protein subfamily C member 21 [Sesbania bispinosa]